MFACKMSQGRHRHPQFAACDVACCLFLRCAEMVIGSATVLVWCPFRRETVLVRGRAFVFRGYQAGRRSRKFSENLMAARFVLCFSVILSILRVFCIDAYGGHHGRHLATIT